MYIYDQNKLRLINSALLESFKIKLPVSTPA